MVPQLRKGFKRDTFASLSTFMCSLSWNHYGLSDLSGLIHSARYLPRLLNRSGHLLGLVAKDQSIVDEENEAEVQVVPVHYPLQCLSLAYSP